MRIATSLTRRPTEKLTTAPNAFQFTGFELGKPAERFAWKRVRHHAPDAVWPPGGVYLRMDYAAPAASPSNRVRVSVHYELYDRVPVMSTWISVHNRTDKKITVDRFTSEVLAVVEHANWVEKREGVPLPQPEVLHVETDMAFGGFQPANACRQTVHWRADPQFHTQVNYKRETPCLLVVEPVYGPAQDVAPGGTFESFRAFELIHDATDRERRGLALRRMYRTIAPWVTENPLMMHMRTAEPAAVRKAIDQCAEVGFEMVILSFGSGFSIENDDLEYISACTALADYALAPPVVPWQAVFARAARKAVAFKRGADTRRYDAPSRRQAGLGYGPGCAVLPRLRGIVPSVAVTLYR